MDTCGAPFDSFASSLAQTIEDEVTYREVFNCQDAQTVPVDFAVERVRISVLEQNPDGSVQGVVETGDDVIVRMAAPTYCGGAAPRSSAAYLVVPASALPVRDEFCQYGKCEGPLPP